MIDFTNKTLYIEEKAQNAIKNPTTIFDFLQLLTGNYKLDVNARIQSLTEKDELADINIEDDEDIEYLTSLSESLETIKSAIKNNKPIEGEGLSYLETLTNNVIEGKEPINTLIGQICDYYKSDVSAIIDDLNDSSVEATEDYDPDNEINYYERLSKTLDSIKKMFTSIRISKTKK